MGDPRQVASLIRPNCCPATVSKQQKYFISTRAQCFCLWRSRSTKRTRVTARKQRPNNANGLDTNRTPLSAMNRLRYGRSPEEFLSPKRGEILQQVVAGERRPGISGGHDRFQAPIGAGQSATVVEGDDERAISISAFQAFCVRFGLLSRACARLRPWLENLSPLGPRADCFA
jgi:hypothetical protein